MKINVMGLIQNAAMGLKYKDPFTAFVLLELGNNLRLVMRGEDTFEEWCKLYVGQDQEPFDIDALLPRQKP